MDELVLIGIGTGNPDHVTGEGRAAIQSVDAILIPRKGSDKADLAELRRDICRDVLGDLADQRIVYFDLPKRDLSVGYRQGVDDWHDAIAVAWQTALASNKSASVGLLVWGDPSLYDSTLRIANRLDPKPKVRVIAGITALQALTAAHAIPLNEINDPVVITTGRALREKGWPVQAETVAVMLDGELSFKHLDDTNLYIWWGAHLGMANQSLVHGRLSDVADQIEQRRAEARAAHGWVMDTYLLKRRRLAT